MTTIGSLFSGIGGLELGMEAAGLGRVVWQVECDPFCLAVLAKHWPTVKRFQDVRTVGAVELARVFVLVGGFPCQDVSSAGDRAGLAGERSGLWFEQRRIIEELCPPAVAVENVTSGEKLWLPRVQHDLLSLGYRVEAWRLGAVDVGAPHRRARTFVLGVHPDECRAALGNADPQGQRQKTSHRQERRRVEDASPLADAERQQLREQPGGGPRAVWARSGRACGVWSRKNGPSFGPLGGVPDGLSARLDGHRWPAGLGERQHEEEPPRTAKKGQVPRNAARLRVLGNAVVPQVAMRAGWRLRQMIEEAST